MSERPGYAEGATFARQYHDEFYKNAIREYVDGPQWPPLDVAGWGIQKNGRTLVTLDVSHSWDAEFVRAALRGYYGAQ